MPVFFGRIKRGNFPILATSFGRPNRVGTWPFPKEPGEERKKDWREVRISYSEDEVVLEAQRCLLCGTPVCVDACPVFMDVRGMCESASRRDFGEAFERIRETNAMTSVTGRCCPQLQGLCEDACVMKWAGQPISIGMIQTFISDWARKNHKYTPAISSETGKKVAVIGSGPAGLAGAELLRRYGHRVKIFEQFDKLGGTARYGIPDYHLPKTVLDEEIELILNMGIEVQINTRIGDQLRLHDLFDDQFDAVLVTTGPWDIRTFEAPGADLQGVFDAYTFLRDVYLEGVQNYLKRPKYEIEGKDVVVVGGGDSALDASRTAIRLGAKSVTMMYRRSEKELPADPILVEEGAEEGLQFAFQSNPKSFEGDSTRRLVRVIVSKMDLGPPDKSGRREPIPIPGSDYVMNASLALLAIGRGPNTYLSKREGIGIGKHNEIVIDDKYSTNLTGVFAAGDVTTGETLVVKAMGSGREAAQRVHEYLMGLDDKHVSLYEEYFLHTASERLRAHADLPPV
jgi:glutamate synthase (NADPH/NADH) small chain